MTSSGSGSAALMGSVYGTGTVSANVTGSASLTTTGAGVVGIGSGNLAAQVGSGVFINTLSAANINLSSSSNIFINGTLTSTSSTGALNLTASGDIVLNTATLTTSGGTVALNADSDALNGGAISIETGSSIASNGGDITLGGVGNATHLAGVSLLNASIDAGSGNISILGRGQSGGMNDATGVKIFGGTVLQTTSGNITVVGTGGPGASGDNNIGVIVNGTNTTIRTTSGAISVTGTGDGAGWVNDGVNVGSGALIESLGSGTITLTGVGSDEEFSSDSIGVVLYGTGARVRSVTGAIVIDGTGRGTAIDNRGVGIGDGAVVSSSSTAPITIIGTSSAADWAIGIGSLDTSPGGTVSTGGTLTLSTTGNILIDGPATLFSAGAQTITAGGNLSLIAEGGSVSVSSGSTQTVTIGGTLSLQGGSFGASNSARLFSTGNQTISATGITLTGGASGGGLNTGNFALIRSAGSQNVSVGIGGLHLTGGGGSLTQNFASIFQGGLAGTSQTVTVNDGGTIVLQGGSSAQSGIGSTNNGSSAFITADGDSQQINFTLGSAIDVTGGTVGSGNSAGIQARNGTQMITGSPSITLTGGASGGMDGEGNFALIQARVGAQTITAGNTFLNAGIGGTNNFAAIVAPEQNITVNGDLALMGGGSNPGTIGAGARIGGLGGTTPTPTNLTLSVDGDVTLTGGTLAGATGSAIGSGGLATAQTTDITMNVGGNVTLNAGTASGARIGSPSTATGGGDITLAAGGNIAMNANGLVHTAIGTSGAVNLTAAGAGGIALDIVYGDSLFAHALNASVMLNSGANLEVSGTGQALVLVAANNFLNSAGASALNAVNGRWLVYSTDPASNTFGALDSANAALWNATYASLPPVSVVQTGNRYLFSYQPTAIFTSTSTNKIYGTDATTAVAGAYSVSGLNAGIANAYLADTNATVFSGTPSVTSSGSVSSATVAGSPYAITVAQGGLSALNGYAFAFVDGNLVIDKAAATVTANSGAGTYSGLSQSVSGFTASGLVNGEAATVLTGVTAGGFGLNAGTYTSIAGGTDGNYNLSFNTGTLAIAKAALTVTANSTSRIYGDGNPVFSGVISGFQNSETSAVLTSQPGYSSGATSSSNVASYPIGGAGGTADNYNITTYVNGLLAVTPRPLTASYAITAKTYDGSASAAIGTPTFGNVIASDLASLGIAGAGAYDTRHVGTGKAVTYTGLSLSGSAAGNYSLSTSTAIGLGTITQLASVNWTGSGSSGDFYTAANWAGGAIPDNNNVAAILFPSGLNYTSTTPILLGNTAVSSTGNLTLDVSGGFTSGAGAIIVSGGGFNLTVHSPISIGSGGIQADTGIQLTALTASADSTIDINGAIASTTGPVGINAYGNLSQSAAISGGSISLTSSAGNIAMAPTATNTVPTGGTILVSAPAGTITSAAANFTGATPTLSSSIAPTTTTQMTIDAIAQAVLAIQPVVQAPTSPVVQPPADEPIVSTPVEPSPAVTASADPSTTSAPVEDKTEDKPADEPVILIVTVANTTVQKPADQIVQVDGPKGSLLVCR